MSYPRLSGEEISQRGEALYEKLRAQLELDENIGKIVAINVETGELEIDKDLLAASERLQAKQPDASIWAGRIGYNAVYAIGGTLIRTV